MKRIAPAAAPDYQVRPIFRAVALSIRASIRAPTLLWILAMTLGGCGRHDKHPSPAAPPLALGWISPAAGDSVAGLVDLEVEIHGTGVRNVVFLAGGISIDTTTAAPWTGQWHCRNIDAPIRVVLQAVVQREDGSALTGGEILVWAVPNRPPQITLVLPRPATWIERNAGTRLEAVAVDPEDGPIPPECMRWTGLGLGRPVTGAVLPLEILRDEEQWLVVEAADRWNECTRETLAIRPFRYLAAETPTVCADNAVAAIRAMDPTGLAAMLADSFLFVPCADEATSAGWPLIWTRGEFLEMAGAWLLAPSTAQIGFEWTPVHVNAWRTTKDERAWMECAQASIRFRENGGSPGVAAETPGTEFTVAVGSTMQISLRRVAGEPWRIMGWRELATGNGRSFAGLLASTIGLPAPRAGAGCGVRPMSQLSGPPRSRLAGQPRVALPGQPGTATEPSGADSRKSPATTTASRSVWMMRRAASFTSTTEIASSRSMSRSQNSSSRP